MKRKWDIFCKVIDNFGDIGVCARLARILSQEYGQVVRLFVDDLSAFAAFKPRMNPTAPHQVVDGVSVHLWSHQNWNLIQPADVIVEGFACEIPEIYVQSMTRCSRKPTWFNLEYLSAEAWTEDIHHMPSPHPTYPLVKHFCVPGFRAKTGGLLREKTLIPRLEALHRSPELQKKVWTGLHLRTPRDPESQVFLFCYNIPLGELMKVLTQFDHPVRLLVPTGKPSLAIEKTWGKSLDQDGHLWWGSLEIDQIPMVEPDHFDEILSLSDWAIVRGEDSFVRAQWAGIPFIWNIYTQEEDAHLAKLNAFLELYLPFFAENIRPLIHDLWMNLNQNKPYAPTLKELLQNIREWKLGALHWREHLLRQNSLIEQMMSLIQGSIKKV